jgi:DNA-binding CsgD family transcriptional regulator
MATSQTKLGLVDERVVGLAPLEVPGEDVSDEATMARSPAVELYRTRAESVSERDADDVRDVAALCRRLEGLPLAIELAAARARTVPASAALALLDELPLDALRGGPRDAVTRHDDLRGAIAWTDSLLTDDERLLLRRVSVAPSPFDLDLAVAADGRSPADVLDALSALVDFHLVDPLGDGWFTMPASIRAYASESFDHEDRDAVVDRVVRWCAGERSWTGAREAVALEGALALAVDTGRTDEALLLVDRLGPMWHRARRRQAHHDRIEAVLAMPGDGATSAVRARAVLWSCLIAPPTATSENRELLLARLVESEAIARAEDDHELLLRAIAARFMANAALGDVEDTAAVIAEARVIAERLGDRRWIADCELWASRDAYRRLDLETAIRHALAGLIAGKELRDDRIVGHAAMILAPLRDSRPELAVEVPTLEEVLDPVRRAGLTEIEAYLLPMIVDDAVHAGAIDPAVQWCRDGLEIAAEDPEGVVAQVNLLAAVYVALAVGDEVLAARLYGVVRPGIELVLLAAQAFRTERHDKVVASLQDSLGPRFDELAREGAARTRLQAIEEALAALQRHAPAAAPPQQAKPQSTRLSPRERKVLALLAAGMTNKEIGAELSMSPKTVMHHTSAIYRRLGVRGRSEAAFWAANNGVTGA